MRRVSVSSDAYPVMSVVAARDGAPVRIAGASRFALIFAGLAALAGCAQPVQRVGMRIDRSPGEYFPEGKYGHASPRVVADGSPVPRGGGQYLVGRPYTIAGRRYFPTEQPREVQVGMASYYGGAFHGRRTANGEIYDMSAVSAAHPTMPLPSYARVTNLKNGRSMIVRVNDRGPYHGGRIMDVSQRVAEALDFRRAGTAPVKVEYVGRAALGGSDDEKLMATLRTDGVPATIDGTPRGAPVMVARNEPPPPPKPAPQRIAMTQEMRPAPFEPVARRAATTTVIETPPPATQHVLPAVAFAGAPPALPVRAPLPPVRPFDLGTIPGAGVPIAASRPTALNYAPAPGPVARAAVAPFSRYGSSRRDGEPK
jgi:rare lipoprotein A